MKFFNLYYNDSKINNRPLSKEELDNIMKTDKDIIKHNNITGKNEKIPLNKIRVIKTIVI